MPDAYTDWSPLASAQALRLQLGVSLTNARDILATLRTFDVGLLTVLAAALAALALAARRAWIGAPEAAALFGCAVVFGLYLPVFAGAARYYLVCIPMLLFLGLRVADRFPARWAGPASIAILLSMALAVTPGLLFELQGGRAAPVTAQTRAIMDALADQPPGGIEAAGRDGRPALHAAFRLGRTFNGFRNSLDDQAVHASQARFLVLVAPDPTLTQAAARIGVPLPVAHPSLAIFRLDR